MGPNAWFSKMSLVDPFGHGRIVLVQTPGILEILTGELVGDPAVSYGEGQAPFLSSADLLTIAAYTIFLYLSLE